MHRSAMNNCQSFFDTYKSSFSSHPEVKVIEIGSLDVNGSIRNTVPSNFAYVGVDFASGKGVDVILSDPYTLPFESESADIVLSSSCFEHSEMFWIVFLEIMRVLKPKGLFYLNVPSNGLFHRHPVDCWRFYPDSGRALIAWAKRNSINAALLESYTSAQSSDIWNDFVAVFLKDESFVSEFPERIAANRNDITNALLFGSNEFLKYSQLPEDQSKLRLVSNIVSS